MLISQAGLIKIHVKTRCKKHKQAGFTLVEVLVVLLIFGIMAGAVVLNFPNRKNSLYELGTQMATHLERTAQSSLIERQTFGVKFSPKGYEIVEYSDGKWAGLQKFTFSEDFLPNMTLTKNGAPINLKDKLVQSVPLVRYDTTGLATPFNLILENKTSSIQLVSDYTGKISIKYGDVDDG